MISGSRKATIPICKVFFCVVLNTLFIFKGCSAIISGVPERMRKHADVCKKVQAMGLWIPRRTPKKILTQFFKPGHEQVHEAIARVVFAGNLPFSWVEKTETRRMFGLLAPGVLCLQGIIILLCIIAVGCPLPSRKHLSTTLLNRQFEATVAEVKAELAGSLVTMSMDGWSNPSMASVIGVAIGEHPVALVDDPGRKHDIPYLTEVAMAQIPKLQDQYNCSVVALVTDAQVIWRVSLYLHLSSRVSFAIRHAKRNW